MKGTVSIVVLGDLGRSPRMMYHLDSLLREGFQVQVVAYLDTPLPEQLQNHENVRFFPLTAPGLQSRHQLARPLFIAYSGLRVLKQFAKLANLLMWRMPKSDYILVQNPPSIPTLLLTHWTGLLRRTPWIIDWHNFGSSILALKLGETHPLVRAYGWLERYYGRKAGRHLCVSNVMKTKLEHDWELTGVTCFHDHSPEHLRLEKQDDIFKKLELIPEGFEDAKVLISSSSWTRDENFDLLLDALKQYDARSTQQEKLLVLLTGKGSGREKFEHKVAQAGLSSIRIQTAWLDTEEYAKALSSADLGLSLHTSSSGLDLPMKIADMLGAGIPVCAYDYGRTLQEQIRDKDNGVLFKDSSELADQLHALFNPETGDKKLLKDLQSSAHSNRPNTWHQHWQKTVLPVLDPNRPKVAFLHPTLGMGGAERWMVDSAISLKTLGCDVQVFTNSYRPESSFEDIRSHSLPVKVIGSHLPSHILQRLRVPCVLLRMAWASLRLRWSGLHYDILFTDLVSHTLPLVGKKVAKRIVFYGHYPDMYLTPPRQGLYSAYRVGIDRLEQNGLSAADEVLVNSEFTQARFKEAFPEVETQVSYPGIDTTRFLHIKPLPDNITSQDEISLLMVSRIHPDKDLSLAVETLAELRKRQPPWSNKTRLIIAGGFNDDDFLQRDELVKLQQLASELGVSEQVRFCFNNTDEELIKLYESCTVLMYTSAREHFGLVPLEAMAAARPVIASNDGGPSETVLDGDTGFLRRIEPIQFADCVEGLIDQKGLASQMGLQGRKRVIATFDRLTASQELVHTANT